MRRVAFVIVVIAGLTFGGLQILSASATNSTQSTASPFATTEPPSGPELSLERIEGIAQEVSERAREPHPSMKVGEGTLEDAMRTIDPTTTFPETGQAVRNMLKESIVLAVLHGHFVVNDAHVRKGAPPPEGTVMDLVIDRHTGAVVGRALPAQEAEGGLPLATVASAPRTGLLVGRLGVGGGPLKRHGRRSATPPTGLTVLITGRHFSRKVVTASNGTFRARLKLGSYTVRGLVGGLCPSVNVLIKAGKQTRTTVLCSIR
jgi:hypothetical protein